VLSSLIGLLQQHNKVEYGCVASVSFYKFHIKYKNKLHDLEFDYNNTAQNILSFRQLYKNKRGKIFKKICPIFWWVSKLFQLFNDRTYSARLARTTLIFIVQNTGENSCINLHAHDTTALRFILFFKFNASVTAHK
jgi:hypothetical protein